METKNFLGLDGLKRFWEKAKTWIVNEITSKIAEIVAEAPEDLNTLKEISDWISTHADDASAMNSNIIKNQSDINELNNKLSSMEQTNFKAIFDLVRPVGDVYVQYPQQANPNELWGAFSTWQVVNYDGAFFRAEGTNANAFIEKTDVLSKQAGQNLSHNHIFTPKGTINNKVLTGRIGVTARYILPQEGIVKYGSDTHHWSVKGGDSGPTDRIIEIDASHAHNFVGSIDFTDYSGSSECRPDNYSVRIWKRTS